MFGIFLLSLGCGLMLPRTPRSALSIINVAFLSLPVSRFWCFLFFIFLSYGFFRIGGMLPPSLVTLFYNPYIEQNIIWYILTVFLSILIYKIAFGFEPKVALIDTLKEILVVGSCVLLILMFFVNYFKAHYLLYINSVGVVLTVARSYRKWYAKPTLK